MGVRVVLDRNCVIDLASGRQPFASQLEPIVDAWRRRELELCVSEITASENQPGDTPPTWEQFETLLDEAGLSEAKVLKPALNWDLGFWDQGLWASEETELLERKIEAILAPGQDMTDRADQHKWINTKCDCLTVWTHVWYDTDVLLTRDGQVLGNARQLAGAVGARVQNPVTFAASLAGN